MTKRNVMITIATSRIQIGEQLFEQEAGDEGELPIFDLPAEEMPEPTELFMEGRLITGRDRVELVWDESELSGMGGSTAVVGFDRATPGMVSMIRSGTVATAMMFEAGKRHMSVYDTPFSSFEVCVHTLTVENRLLTDGQIDLEYLIEIHGAEAERCVMNITVKNQESLF